MITVAEITLDDFKAWFVRDFQYATPLGETEPTPDCPCNFVTDHDLDKAKQESDINFNPGLFSQDDQLRVSFLYLWAHYLVNDIQTSSAGVNSTGYYPVNSRSVGGVSESYSIPDWILGDPVLGNFATTRYGMKYLSLVKPLLIGNVQVYIGNTTPI